MSQPTTRTFTAQLVAWCPDCLLWAPEYHIGEGCLMDCPRKLVKRRMWICSVIECHQAYKQLEDAEGHDCFSAY